MREFEGIRCFSQVLYQGVIDRFLVVQALKGHQKVILGQTRRLVVKYIKICMNYSLCIFILKS